MRQVAAVRAASGRRSATIHRARPSGFRTEQAREHLRLRHALRRAVAAISLVASGGIGIANIMLLVSVTERTCEIEHPLFIGAQ